MKKDEVFPKESGREREKKARRVTVLGMMMNLFLAGLKLISGAWLKSSALLADGIHSLSDVSSDIVVLAAARLSNRPADRSHPYGHQKFETLAAQVLALILMGLSGKLIWDAVQNLLRHEVNYPGGWVLIVAVVSIIPKEGMYRLTQKTAKEIHSSSLHANAWHHRSDALSSVAVLIGAAAGVLGWGLGDSAATIVVGLMVFCVGVKIIHSGLAEFTERSADEEIVARIEKVLSSSREITGWHAMRTRISGGKVFVDVHLQVDPGMSVKKSHRIAGRIENEIHDVIPQPSNILIHVDPDSGG